MGWKYDYKDKDYDKKHDYEKDYDNKDEYEKDDDGKDYGKNKKRRHCS